MTTAWMVFVTLFPRLTLLYSYITESMPYNETPFWVDVLCSVFMPRLLVGYWGYQWHDANVLWLVLLVFLTLAEWSNGASNSRD